MGGGGGWGWGGGGGADSARHFEGIELFPARHLLEQYGLVHDEDHKWKCKYKRKYNCKFKWKYKYKYTSFLFSIGRYIGWLVFSQSGGKFIVVSFRKYDIPRSMNIEQWTRRRKNQKRCEEGATTRQGPRLTLGSHFQKQVGWGTWLGLAPFNLRICGCFTTYIFNWMAHLFRQ